jgi:hypothetical protein
MEISHRGSSVRQRTRKPNSVYAVIPLGAALPRTLSSDLPGGFGHCMEQPYGAGPAPNTNLAPDSRFPPYLVLLRVGFTLPPALRPERCALTAPFHPYSGNLTSRGGMFSVALAVHGPSSPCPGRYPAHCPAEFGLSSPGPPITRGSGSDRPVLLPAFSVSRIWFSLPLPAKTLSAIEKSYASPAHIPPSITM